MSRIGALPAALLALLLLAGCRSPVGVDRPGADAVYAGLRANAITRGVPSGATRIVLGRRGLEGTWERHPPEALERLLDAAGADHRRDEVLALAELHYLACRDGWGEEHALAAAAAAWAFLFDGSLGPLPDPWLDEVRIAGDLYNLSLLEALRTAPGESRVDVAAGRRGLPRGAMDLGVAYALPEPEEGLSLLPADDFAVRGLRVRDRRTGLGLRLIAAPPRPERPALERGVFRVTMAFPGTAVLVPEGGIAALVSGKVAATLHVLDPRERRTLPVGALEVPLAADFTAPLALALEASPMWGRETAGFFSGARELPPGLAMVSRRRGRVPVVFVHGTASSPGRWAEMINTLSADPGLRDRIQAWVFIYPTGNPVAFSAAQLRESLADAVAELDPEGRDPSLHRMVLVGHSQGGLLCRMVSSSRPPGGHTLPDGRAIADLGLSPEAEALVRRCMEFEASPHVGRVVFLATPHGGSFFAGNWISRLAASFIEVARTFEGALADTFRERPGRIVIPEDIHIPTAVDNMIPGSEFLATYAALIPGPGVAFHSIIPVDGEGDPAGLDDGIVAYGSAHLEGVASEFVVRSGHSCQDHPLVIEEVRRILLEHLDGARAPGKGPAPAPAATSPGSRP